MGAWKLTQLNSGSNFNPGLVLTQLSTTGTSISGVKDGGSELQSRDLDLSSLYVCMVNIKLKYNFAETPRKCIIAKLSIRQLGSNNNALL